MCTPCSVHQDWSPHIRFISKGSQMSALQLKGWFESQTSIQEYRKGNTKFISNLCMIYMVHVFSMMWRRKNQPSNFTSCSDDALRLLCLVTGILYWGLQAMSSYLIWGCALKGYFEGHWRLQSWTLTHAQWSGRFLGIITGWDPSVCKSNRFHVDILRFSFVKLGIKFYQLL